jgi:lipopolysaccharide export system permease protein
MLTLAVPMSVLVATLMAFGSLSSSNEITVMKASGVSLNRLMVPVLIFAGLITYLMVLFNNDVLPEANHQARLLLGDISRTKPTFILESGKFSEDISGVKILVKKTFENNNNLEGVFIYDYSNPTVRNLVTAKRGDIGFTEDFKNIIMNLEDGEIHQLNNIDFSDKYRKVKFERHRLIFDSEGFGFKRTGDNSFIRGDRELSASAMNKIIDSIKVELVRSNQNFSRNIFLNNKKLTSLVYRDTVIRRDTAGKRVDTLYNNVANILRTKEHIRMQSTYIKQINAQLDAYQVEIYKKYSIPFACFIFAMIGAPLGYRVKKGGFGIAAGLSLLFFLIYWAALIGGEKLADRNLVTPFIGMWLVNIFLGLFGLYLMFKSS